VKIGVIGAGVVGGTLASLAQEKGHDVDVYDPRKGFDDELVLSGSDVIFICVWTPNEGGKLDTSAVFNAVETAVRIGTPVVAVRSTIPLGVMTQLEDRYPDQHFAFVPEFLLERDPLGSARNADRIVIGSPRAEGAARAVLRGLEDLLQELSPGTALVRLNCEEAVMVKLASNTLLAAKVAISVELHDLSAAYGIDWERVQGAVSLDRRIGPSHLTVTPERGYGGSCFPKDVQGVIAAAREAWTDIKIIDTIQSANLERFRG
jgi:UDPglucose 6-dehydrogenase